MRPEWKIRSRGHVCAMCARGFDDGEACVSILAWERAEPLGPIAEPAADGAAESSTPAGRKPGRPMAGDADARWERHDFCLACWERSSSRTAADCVWQGCYRKPPPAGEAPAAQRETAESLLRRLLDADQPEHTGVIYVLAAMLERARVLVERDVRQMDGGWRMRVYEHRRSGETFIVADPELRLDALDDVQRQVMAMLAPPGGGDGGGASDTGDGASAP